MKRVVAVMVMLTVVGFGCSYSGPGPEPRNDIPTAAQITKLPPSAAIAPDKSQTYISPGKVNVGNFFVGATASYPLTVHNGGRESQQWKVTSDKDDHTVTLKLNKERMDATIQLREDGPIYEHGIYAISSNLRGDNLVITEYLPATNELIVTGLLELSTRIIEVIYQGSEPQQFSVSYRTPDNVPDGVAKAPIEARNWVLIADTTPLIAVWETRAINITLAIPDTEKAVIPKDWEFWVAAGAVASGPNQIQTQMAVRWIVSMAN